jgi:hypothetical protein
MFLRFCDAARAKRIKGGKEHQYWSVVENRRVADGRVVQRHMALGNGCESFRF